MLIKLSLLLSMLGIIELKKPSCDKVRIDSVTRMPFDYYVFTIGERGWLTQRGASFNVSENWAIGDYCPGFKRSDLTFWWGPLGENKNCTEDKNLDERSMMLMQKVDSKCQWCYLLDGEEEQADWDKNGTLLKELTKKLEQKGCDKIEAVAYQSWQFNAEKRHSVISVVDGRFEKMSCQLVDGSSVLSWHTEVNEALENIYPNLPKEKPVSIYSKIDKGVLENFFIYSDGRSFYCTDVDSESQLPLPCTVNGNVFYAWNVCEMVSATDTTAPNLPLSTSSKTTRGLSGTKNSNFQKIVILLTLIVLAIVVIIITIWKLIKEFGPSKKEHSDEFEQPLLNKKRKKIVKVYKENFNQ